MFPKCTVTTSEPLNAVRGPYAVVAQCNDMYLPGSPSLLLQLVQVLQPCENHLFARLFDLAGKEDLV